MSNKEFVEEYYKLIISACKNYYSICIGYIELEDFINHCCLKFLYRKPFDPNRGVKPSSFIYKCVFKEALNIVNTNKAQKRYISQKNLVSIDSVINDEHSKYNFNECNILESYDDYSSSYVKELIELIKTRLSDEQILQFEYMLQGLTPRDVEEITGKTKKEIFSARTMVKRKAKQEIEKYNKK